MPSATYHFPTGFMWGTATSSHQVEGGNTNNNWAAWEKEPGRIVNGDRAGLACDWWGGRWRDDFDRAAEGGQNAHRLSIEWSRVQPAPDRWDEDALDYYREMVRGLVERGMTPMVTLHHFTDPLWLTERGGWENDETPALFDAFTARVVTALKEYVTLWCTINEPNVYVTQGYLDTAFPPGKVDLGAAFTVMRNMVKGHATAYRTIHRLQPQARVGFALNYRGFIPARPGFLPDRWMANFLFANFNGSFVGALMDGRLRFGGKRVSLPEAAGTQDYFGLNYYTADLVRFVLDSKRLFSERFYPPDADLSGGGYLANLPECFAQAIKWAVGIGKPVIISENGVEDASDRMRPRYLVEHIHKVWRAVNLNAPVKGYFHWSLVDNFEWERGWSQRFGLWGLDVPTRARIRRKSADFYAAICKENGIDSRVVAQYAPEVFEKLFPG